MKPKKITSRRILSKKEPEKKLLVSFKNRAGRAHSGRITVRHRGGGVKKMYRIVDFGQEKLDIEGTVIALEYDPNRTAFLALVEYKDKEKKYILASKNIRDGDKIICSEKTEVKEGNRMRMENIPVGTQIYNIELVPGEGGKMARSAGTSAKVLTHEGRYTHLKMPSGELRKVFKEGFASIGQVSHAERRFEKYRKAGQRRLKGWRPTVRGTVMNPIDHPHGGGTGKAPIGMKHPKTPWGKNAYGVRTRRKTWTNKLIIKRRKTKR